MKKHVLILLILILGISVALIAAPLDTTVVKLQGTVPLQNAVITLYDENGAELNTTAGELSFVFSSHGAESITQSVIMKYSANLPAAASCNISFDITELAIDENHKIDTTMVIESSDSSNVTVDGNALVVTFPKGKSTDYEFAVLKITASKDGSNMLPTGEYTGALTVRYTSVN